jgi:hypothetical protein
VTRKDQHLQWQKQRANPQARRMDDADRIDHMQIDLAPETQTRICQSLVIARIGIGQTGAARRDVVGLARIKRLHVDRERARRALLLHVQKAIRWPHLTGSDHILHFGDHHGDNREGLGKAGHLGKAAFPHNACGYLLEPCLKATAPGIGRHQHSGGPEHWVDDIADTQGHLLHCAGYSGIDGQLRYLILRLLQCRDRTGPLCRQEQADVLLRHRHSGACGVDRPLSQVHLVLQHLYIAR